MFRVFQRLQSFLTAIAIFQAPRRKPLLSPHITENDSKEVVKTTATRACVKHQAMAL
jgi:hypothetical protein